MSEAGKSSDDILKELFSSLNSSSSTKLISQKPSEKHKTSPSNDSLEKSPDSSSNEEIDSIVNKCVDERGRNKRTLKKSKKHKEHKRKKSKHKSEDSDYENKYSKLESCESGSKLSYHGESYENDKCEDNIKYLSRSKTKRKHSTSSGSDDNIKDNKIKNVNKNSVSHSTENHNSLSHKSLESINSVFKVPLQIKRSKEVTSSPLNEQPKITNDEKNIDDNSVEENKDNNNPVETEHLDNSQDIKQLKTDKLDGITSDLSMKADNVCIQSSNQESNMSPIAENKSNSVEGTFQVEKQNSNCNSMADQPTSADIKNNGSDSVVSCGQSSVKTVEDSGNESGTGSKSKLGLEDGSTKKDKVKNYRERSRSASRSGDERGSRDTSRTNRVKRSRSGSRHRRRNKRYSRSRSRSRRRDSRSTSRSDRRFRRSSSRSKTRKSKKHYRSRSRSRRRRSRSDSRNRNSHRYKKTRRAESPDSVDTLRDKVTRKKLLDVARKNAVYLMQNNCLPPNVEQEQVKSTGKSVDELTRFCRQLVAKDYSDGDKSDPSLSPDDRETRRRSFSPATRHPFAVKDKPIMMNIRNASMIPIKSNAERLADATQLRQQFPVSSGTQHRTAAADTNANAWVPVVKDESSQGAKDAKGVFPELNKKVDISQLVTTRINAMRKLQSNPRDHEARSALNNAQKEMQSWAVSKQAPGQFTGSTGAKIMSQEELNSGYQAWAKKDQFKVTAPVRSEFGLKMLQKMGWKPGDGLGKKRDGQINPLSLDFKNDKKGLSAAKEVTPKRAPVMLSKSLAGKHPVSALTELCFKRKWNVPDFEVIYDTGPDHKKHFLLKVNVNNTWYQPAMASPTKKIAKANASAVALQALGLIPKDEALPANGTSKGQQFQSHGKVNPLAEFSNVSQKTQEQQPTPAPAPKGVPAPAYGMDGPMQGQTRPSGYTPVDRPMPGPGYGKPAVPMTGSGYGKPAVPMTGSGYGKPEVPMSGSAFRQPEAPMTGSGFRQPEAPMTGSGFRQPEAPMTGSGYRQPEAPMGAPMMGPKESAGFMPQPQQFGQYPEQPLPNAMAPTKVPSAGQSSLGSFAPPPPPVLAPPLPTEPLPPPPPPSSPGPNDRPIGGVNGSTPGSGAAAASDDAQKRLAAQAAMYAAASNAYYSTSTPYGYGQVQQPPPPPPPPEPSGGASSIDNELQRFYQS